jgi:hypothetical protein
MSEQPETLRALFVALAERCEEASNLLCLIGEGRGERVAERARTDPSFAELQSISREGFDAAFTDLWSAVRDYFESSAAVFKGLRGLSWEAEKDDTLEWCVRPFVLALMGREIDEAEDADDE